MDTRRCASIVPSVPSGTGPSLAEDKWKDIDSQISSMMDWIPSSQNPSGVVGNARQGHTHRRSEPDVVMIRRALPQQFNNVPQSAPVRPGGFALDWNVKSASASRTSNRQLANTSNADAAVYTKEKSSSPICHETNDGLYSNFNGPRVPPPYAQNNHSGAISAPGSGNSSPFICTKADSPSSNSALHTGTHSHTPPITVIPEGPVPVSHHPFPPTNRIMAVAFSPSPKSNRRSSAPNNQLDPRSHSASPNITRRSASHTATMHRSKTQDNFAGRVPSIPHDAKIAPSNNSVGASANYFMPVHTTTQDAISTSVTVSPTSLNDDKEYTKVLLQHQHERMERLRKDLTAKKGLLDSLTFNVREMENQVFQKRNENISALMPSLDDVTKLRDVNRQMEIDCNCMIKEVESVSKSGYALNKNFHEFISTRNPIKKKNWPTNDLPSPPLPPPPVPPPIENDDETKWACHYCTFLNHAALNKCEICEYRRESPAVRAPLQQS